MIGGGPSRLNGALKFGRGMKQTLVTDEAKPRNRVILLSNGYLTQDAVRAPNSKKLKQTWLNIKMLLTWKNM